MWNVHYKQAGFLLYVVSFMIKQSIGKAEYINDLPKKPRECYAEFVLSTEANAKIQSIDPSEALVCTICVP